MKNTVNIILWCDVIYYYCYVVCLWQKHMLLLQSHDLTHMWWLLCAVGSELAMLEINTFL